MYINELVNKVSEIFKKNGYEIDVTISKSDRPELCDMQCNDVFKLAKEYKDSPINIGNKLVEAINSENEINKYFKKVEFCPPGFINFTLSDEYINKYLKIFNKDIKNSIKLPDKEKIVIDYGGPNVAKPLHVGHMRTAIVGESIKRILKYFNQDVISDVHLGDVGLQIGQVIYDILNSNISLENITLDYLNVIYPKMSKACKEDDELKAKCAKITKDLQDGNEEYYNIWKKISEVSVKEIKNNYDYLDVSFDYWYGEMDSIKYLDRTTKILEDVLEESEGALVVDIYKKEDKVELPPLIYRKSDGGYLYGSTDLATIVQRKYEFNPNKILYVTDLRQALHFKQVFRTCEKSYLFEIENLEHLGYGTVNGDDNKPFKTRSGDTPKLMDLFSDAKDIFVGKREENKNLDKNDLDIIVNSILKFADLQNSRDKDYIFDLNKFSEVNGKTGPYLLYTYLRINKVLNEYKIDEELSDEIYNVYDRNLRLKLLEIGKALEISYIERKPNYIADYVYTLCSEANIFYQHNYLSNVKNDQNLNDWLFVLNLTNKYIKELLDLLVIKIPNEM